MTGIAPRPVHQLLDLSGRKAVVTGAGAGIGFAVASRLAEAGASVLISDLDRERVEKAAELLTAKGYQVQPQVCDCGSETDIISLFAHVSESFGGVDILVNNAGIYPAVPILEMSVGQWRDVMRINLESAFLCTREAGRQMVRQGKGGVIVNISSMAALKPCFSGLAHYGSSKGGVINLTRSTALELARHGIRAVAVVPGGILTDGVKANLGREANPEKGLKGLGASVPMQRLGDPDEIARTVLFLASDAASYITGSAIAVDGGAMLV